MRLAATGTGRTPGLVTTADSGLQQTGAIIDGGALRAPLCEMRPLLNPGRLGGRFLKYMRSARQRIASAWLILGTLGLALNGCVTNGPPSAIDSVAAEVLWLPAGARLEQDAARPAFVRDGRSIY